MFFVIQVHQMMTQQQHQQSPPQQNHAQNLHHHPGPSPTSSPSSLPPSSSYSSSSSSSYSGYLSFPRHRVIAFRPDRKCVLESDSGQTTVVQVSMALVLIGAHPNLSFLHDNGRPLGINPQEPVSCRRNPIEVDPFSYEVSAADGPGMYAMGPLVGENFVRFLKGGALAIASDLAKRQRESRRWGEGDWTTDSLVDRLSESEVRMCYGLLAGFLGWMEPSFPDPIWAESIEAKQELILTTVQTGTSSIKATAPEVMFFGYQGIGISDKPVQCFRVWNLQWVDFQWFGLICSTQEGTEMHVSQMEQLGFVFFITQPQ